MINKKYGVSSASIESLSDEKENASATSSKSESSEEEEK